METEIQSLSHDQNTMENTVASLTENIQSLENSNEELQERLVAIGLSTKEVLVEVEQYCGDHDVKDTWSDNDGDGDGDGDGDNEAKEPFLEKGVIEKKLEQVRTSCNRLSQRLTSVAQEKDELKRVSSPMHFERIRAHIECTMLIHWQFICILIELS